MASVEMVRMSYSPCSRCPLVKKPGFMKRMLGLYPRTDDSTSGSYCRGRGPEELVVGGTVTVDYAAGEVMESEEREKFCPADVTDGMIAASDGRREKIVDTYSDALAELVRMDREGLFRPTAAMRVKLTHTIPRINLLAIQADDLAKPPPHEIIRHVF